MHRSLIAGSAVLTGLLCSSHAAGQDPTYTTFGTGCAGSVGVPLLEADADSLPIFGGTFRARLSNVPDGAAIGILGLSRTTWSGFQILPLGLGLVGMPGCTLYTDLLFLTDLSIVGGEAVWGTALPGHPAFLGLPFYQQVMVLDPSVPGLGAVMSNAAMGIIGIASPGAPAAEIIFPPANSLTDRKWILVRGTASDPDGIAEVRVNGLRASTNDGYETWRRTVPLVPGTNALEVETIDNLGQRNPRAAEAKIKNQVKLTVPTGIAIDRPHNRALVLDAGLHALLAVDLDTGVTTVVSNANRGTGPGLFSPSEIVLDGSRALVLDLGGSNFFLIRRPGVYAIDLTTGDRTLISQGGWGTEIGRGTGSTIDNPTSLALDGSRLLVVRGGFWGSVFAVDLTTGDRTRFGATGTGPSFESPLAIVVDGSRALVTDGGLNAVFAVDLTSGNRTIILSPAMGSGPGLDYPTSIVLDGSRALVADTGSGAVLALDLATGDSTLISNQTTGAGTGFGRLNGIALDRSRVLVTSASSTGLDMPAVLAVDLDTGNRSPFLDNGSGAGPALIHPSGIALDGSRALIVDSSKHAILAGDLATGDRSVLSDNSLGAGPNLIIPRAIALDGSRALVTQDNAVLSVDLASGNRAMISNDNKGSGPSLSRLAAIALDGSRALVADSILRTIFTVDITTGDRAVLSDDMTGTGPGILGPSSIALDGPRALVAQFSSILTVDLTTGDRTVLSGDSIGTGPDLQLPTGIVLDGSRALVAHASSGAVLAVDLVTGDRTVISDKDTGLGPLPIRPLSLALDGRLLFVADSGLGAAIYVIDLQTGERVILSR